MARSAAIGTGLLILGPSAANNACLRAQDLPQPEGYRVFTVLDSLVGSVGGVSVDALGYVYVADFRDNVFRVTPDGRWEKFAGGFYGASGNTIDGDGALFQSSFYGNHVTRVDRLGNRAIVATGIDGPVGVTVLGDDLIVTACLAGTIVRVPGGRIASEPSETVVLSQSPLLSCPNGITVGPDSSLYVINFNDTRILRLSADGEAEVIATLPGIGGGHITSARGELYATAFRGHQVFRIGLDGTVTHVAGSGEITERDGQGAGASFAFPNGIAVNRRNDRLYVNDQVNRSSLVGVTPPAPVSSLRVIQLAPLTDRLLSALAEGGETLLSEVHQAIVADPQVRPFLTERDVNALGYRLLQSGATDQARLVFELNAETHPGSWNVWDSLAEAHMLNGNRTEAIRLYRKSLELNPQNANAVEQLGQLQASN